METNHQLINIKLVPREGHYGLCECGWTSRVLTSLKQVRKAHRDHVAASK